MSTPNPFPTETEEQVQGAELNGAWNPWQGPAKPGFWSGAGFSEDNPLGPIESFALKPLGQATAGGELLLAGAAHRVNAFGAQHFGNVPLVGPFLKDQEQRSAALEQDAAARMNALTPDPTTTGAAVQTIAGLVSGGYRAALGTVLGGPIGGAALLGSTEAATRYQALRAQGVSEGTAAESAGLTGVVSGLGAAIPGGFGASLFSKIATGAAANVALGVGSRYADHQILERAGYTHMADQERVWDGVGLVTDALLGGAFGGLAHLHAAAEAGRSHEGAPSALDEAGARDAALVAHLAVADRQAAPGVAVDPGSQGAHHAALESAMTSLLADEPVDVAHTGIHDAEMLPRPESPSTDLGRQVVAQALQEAGVQGAEQRVVDLEAAMEARLRGEPAPSEAAASEAVQAPAQASPEIDDLIKKVGLQRATPEDEQRLIDAGFGLRTVDGDFHLLPQGREAAGVLSPAEIPRAEPGKLSDEDRAIETRFAQSLADDYEGMKERYAELPESQGGKVLNTDTARELSPDYLADRTKSAAVHEPASWFVKRLYAEQLAEPPGPGEEPTVLFTGGGTGAGKSTAIKNALGPDAERAQIVYDSNMNGLESSEEKIDQALAAGKDVKIAYVYREPIEALKGGALPRAMRQEREFGTGRTVPIEEHLRTHAGSNTAIRELAEHYKGDPRVSFDVIDNSHGPKGARVIPLDELPKIDYNSIREQAHETLKSEHQAGRISDSVFRGFAGREGGAAEAGMEAHGVGSETGGQPEPQRPGQRPDELASEAAGAQPRAPGQFDPLADPAIQAVQEHPDLTIAGDDGQPVKAAEALRDAQQAVAGAERDAPKATQAAVNCFLRKGGG